jgi:glyoxylase-like metal-dependent hydrolase (beta-lactamase superfamily II)
MPACRLALAFVLALGLALPAAAAKPPKGLKLYAMDCGLFEVPNGDMFSDDGAYKDKPERLVVPCFLIRHPKGDLVWDTGVPQETADLPNGKGPGGLTVKHKLTDQLTQLGLTPDKVTYLSVSHGHFDHIGNAGLFAKSTWIVDKRERDWVFRDQARADKGGFARYAALETAKTIIVDGDKPYDVYGDGSVLIYRTPGHTPGHTVLWVDLPKSGPIILAGDMWHIAESRAARRVPRFNFDKAQTLASMDKVEKLAADTHAKVIREHVIADFETLPAFPKPLE